MASTKHLSCSFLFFFFFFLVFGQVSATFDYGVALTKSILYYEAQRSGKLPPNQRVTWRGDSALQDGSQEQIDLCGGYYDAGDNVKYGFPMAYTITMLSWGVLEFCEKLLAKNELENAYAAIRWGTDYLIKAHPEPDVLYAGVGEGTSDHKCWQRPEDMETPRTVFKIDVDHPGSDLAGETAAAFAAASIVFKEADPNYSNILLTHAKQLFQFARTHPGIYSMSIPAVDTFYHSSDNQDEVLWAAAWLFRATNDMTFVNYIDSYYGTGGERSRFSWDDKYVGLQVLISKMILDNVIPNTGKWVDYKREAECFICNVIGKGGNNVKRSNGGLVWWDRWNNLQYTTSAAFITTVYGKYLSEKSLCLNCQAGIANPDELFCFAQSQVDYILGANPKNMSYMVGFGENYPKKVHHRGASIVSLNVDSTPVSCQGGFDLWLHKDAPNPNVLEGAIVGGPYDTDEYTDSREAYEQAEPGIANTAPLVGVLAYLS